LQTSWPSLPAGTPLNGNNVYSRYFLPAIEKAGLRHFRIHDLRHVAKEVAHKFQLRLTSQRQGELARTHPVNAEAYDAFMKGYYFFQRGADDKDTNMAATYFERATHLDPSYAPAWVGLSRARYWRARIIHKKIGAARSKPTKKKTAGSPGLGSPNNRWDPIQPSASFAIQLAYC
jgi:hypothetical protein